MLQIKIDLSQTIMKKNATYTEAHETQKDALINTTDPKALVLMDEMYQSSAIDWNILLLIDILKFWHILNETILFENLNGIIFNYINIYDFIKKVNIKHQYANLSLNQQLYFKKINNFPLPLTTIIYNLKKGTFTGLYEMPINHCYIFNRSKNEINYDYCRSQNDIDMLNKFYHLYVDGLKQLEKIIDIQKYNKKFLYYLCLLFIAYPKNEVLKIEKLFAKQNQNF